jgi:hypothetical protein
MINLPLKTVLSLQYFNHMKNKSFWAFRQFEVEFYYLFLTNALCVISIHLCELVTRLSSRLCISVPLTNQVEDSVKFHYVLHLKGRSLILVVDS